MGARITFLCWGLVVMFNGVAVAEEITYSEHIRPIWEKECSMCHGPKSPYLADYLKDPEKYKALLRGPRMDSYSDLIFYVGWPETGALMRRLDDGSNTGGVPGNMYVNLGNNEPTRQKNLAIFKSWVGEGGWNMNGWKQRGDIPPVTKEQLDKIKVKY